MSVSMINLPLAQGLFGPEICSFVYVSKGAGGQRCTTYVRSDQALSYELTQVNAYCAQIDRHQLSAVTATARVYRKT